MRLHSGHWPNPAVSLGPQGQVGVAVNLCIPVKSWEESTASLVHSERVGVRVTWHKNHQTAGNQSQWKKTEPRHQERKANNTSLHGQTSVSRRVAESGVIISI